MKSIRLLFFLLMSLKGYSQQTVLTTSGEGIVLNYLPLLGGTISGTLGIIGNTTITGTTTIKNTLLVQGATTINNNTTITGTTNMTGLLTTSGGIINTGSLTNHGNLTINGNGTITGTLGIAGNTTITGTLTTGNIRYPNTDGTANQVLMTNGSGVASFGAIPILNQNTTGNAATATSLFTPRNINGVAFDGTGNITVTAAAGTLTGASLATNVLSSSLTSVGTLTSLNIGGSVSAKNYILTIPSTISSTSTTTIDLSTGNVFKISLGSSITALSLSNTNIGTYILEFIQTTGNYTVAFPAAWKWSGGVVPTITATANKTDIITLVYDGTTYFASAVQNF